MKLSKKKVARARALDRARDRDAPPRTRGPQGRLSPEHDENISGFLDQLLRHELRSLTGRCSLDIAPWGSRGVWHRAKPGADDL